MRLLLPSTSPTYSLREPAKARVSRLTLLGTLHSIRFHAAWKSTFRPHQATRPTLGKAWTRSSLVVRATPGFVRLCSSTSQPDIVESAKRNAAHQAVEDHLSPNYRWVGIGSGSTVVYIMEAISKWDKSITDRMAFVPTGDQSKSLIETAGLRLCSLSQLPDDERLDVCFDGADEIDGDNNLIKGGGACLLQEKVVAVASKKFICVADYRKISSRLCTSWTKGIPIEVVPSAATRVLATLRHLGSIEPKIRQGGSQKAGPVVTDNSMWIIDAPFLPLCLASDEAGTGRGRGVWLPVELAGNLSVVPGIVETGLFTEANTDNIPIGTQKPVAIYVGMEDGSVQTISC